MATVGVRVIESKDGKPSVQVWCEVCGESVDFPITVPVSKIEATRQSLEVLHEDCGHKQVPCSHCSRTLAVPDLNYGPLITEVVLRCPDCKGKTFIHYEGD